MGIGYRERVVYMAYGAVPLDKRLKENIKNYSLENLYHVENMMDQMKHLNKLTGLKILLTERHGEKMVSVGNFTDFTPDVVGEPGRKVRVQNRTIGHVYVKKDEIFAGMEEIADSALESLVVMWEALGEATYANRERAVYIDEMSVSWEAEKQRQLHGDSEDVLTGLYNKNYFTERMRNLDKTQTAPVAAIEANINDWKFVNDHYGDEESDRLIRVIAHILKEEAKDEYVLGRVDGDVFYIMIPTPEEGEARDYCDRVQRRCKEYNDPILSPSVAVGIMMKENVEEDLADVFAEAEYAMFENKFEMKQDPVYQARLRRNFR